MRYLKHSNSQKHRTEVTRRFVLLVLWPWGRLPGRHLGLLGPRGLRWWPSPSLRCPRLLFVPRGRGPFQDGGRTRSAPRKRPTGAVGALRGQPCAAQPRAPPQTVRLHVRGYVAAPGPARPGLTCVVQVGRELRRPVAITGLGSRQLLRPRERGPGGRCGRVAPAWVPPAAPPPHPWP